MRKLLLTIIYAMAITPLWAATDSRVSMYVDEQQVEAGDTISIAVKLNNEVDVTAFQCDIFLPQGLEFVKNVETNSYAWKNEERMSVNHTFISSIQSNGALRCLAYDLESSAFVGNSGELIYFTVTVLDSYTGEGAIEIKNVECTQLNGTRMLAEATNSAVMLKTLVVNGVRYCKTSDAEVKVIANKVKYRGEVTIPSNFKFGNNTYNVTAIADSAFSQCTELTAINLPDGLQTIGHHVFYGCTALSSIEIPNSVTYIDGATFMNCGISSITLSENIKAIRYYAFTNCKNLETIKIPNVDNIGEAAFKGCTKLAEVEVPATVQRIYTSAFEGCSSLNSVTLNEGLTTIDGQAFMGCAFSEISIPKTVTSIKRSAFYECANLIEISIPEGITTISEFTFKNCSNLTTVNLPASLTTIEKGLFTGCNKLKKISCNAIVPPSVASEFPNYTATVEVPIGSLDAYKTAEYWKKFSNIVGVGELEIGSTFVVDGITYKKTADAEVAVIAGETKYSGDIVVPANVMFGKDYAITAVADSAFYKCTELTAIKLPDGLKTIGKRSFALCSNIKSIIVPNSVTSIVGAAFSDCTSLESITLPNDIKTLENFLFCNNVSLKSIIIPDAVVSIGENCFQNCTSLTEILFPENIETIGFQAFLGCNNITKIYSNAVTPPNINGKSTFGNYNATLYVLPSSVDAYKNAEYWKNFNVVEIPTIELSQTGLTMNIGDKVTLTATINPADITNSQIKWSSSDDDIAMVDDNGKVVALTPGVATITATTADGKTIDGTCVITISSGLTLTLIDGEGGKFELVEQYGKDKKVKMVPTMEWEINTVTFNGEDVTNEIDDEGVLTVSLVENSVINVVYEKGNTSVQQIEMNSRNLIRIYVKDDTVNVVGAEEDSNVMIFGVDGLNIYNGNEKTISIDEQGVYILTVDNRTFKFAL